MRKQTIVICLSLIVLMVATLTSVKESSHTSDALPSFKAELQRINALIDAHETDAALKLIDVTLTQTDAQHPHLKAWLYVRQAYIYEQRRHYHHAITALKAANQYLPADKQHHQTITALQKAIDSQQNERYRESQYEDARNSGIAKKLSKNITVAYIYLDDSQWSKWSSKDRLQNQFNIEQVKRWYLEQGSHYQQDDIHINVRYFYIRSPKGISKEWLRSNAFFREAQPLITRQLGYLDLREFVEAMSDYNTDNEVALVFHSNNQARSFARSCNHTRGPQRCYFEYVMLTEQINHPLYAWATPQVQAHEILHLFGASDLYNISQAKDYAVTDIMNYYSDSLNHASIDPITAWAVGWAEQPKTPFPIAIVKD